MSGNSVFDDFVATTSQSSTHHPAATRTIERVTVLGGGMDARLLAALCLAEGRKVQLFSAYANEIDAMSGGIALNGHGPVGRYHVESSDTRSPVNPQAQSSSIKATPSIDSCLNNAELIFLTGPVHKQRTYAMVLADHLQDGQILVVPNARTFGALEVSWLLKTGGCTADVTIAEMQGLPFWVAPGKNANDKNSLYDLQPRDTTTLACLPSERTTEVINSLSPLLGDLRPCASVLDSSLLDCSALVEIPALILGGAVLEHGGLTIPAGGVALEENQSFHSLLGPQQLQVVEQLLEERRKVANQYGVRDVPDLEQALHCAAGTATGVGRRMIPDRTSAVSLVRDAVIASLVPLSDAALNCGVATPLTQSMITLCSSLLGSDLALGGRRLSNTGVDTSKGESAFVQLRAMATAPVSSTAERLGRTL